MSSLGVILWIILLSYPAVMGVLISFILYIITLTPLFRHWEHKSNLWYLIEIFTSAALAITVCQMLMIYMACLFAVNALGPFDDRPHAVAAEMWLRYMVPPPFKQACFSSEGLICKSASQTIYNIPKALRYESELMVNLLELSPQEYSQFLISNDVSFQKMSWREYLKFPMMFFVPALLGSASGIGGLHWTKNLFTKANHIHNTAAYR